MTEGPTEHATQPQQRRYLFPPEWGSPPVDWDERRVWILERIEEGRRRRAAGEQVRWLHTPRPDEAQLQLLASVETPAIAAARRQAILAAAEVAGRLLELKALRTP